MALNFYQNVKVLDLGEGISGPFCAKMFADLGARVIKVEPPGGDPARQMGPFPGDLPHLEKSGLFLALNTNKLGLTLNLESAAGREILLKLVEGADLLVENYPPSYLPGLGLDYEVFKARNAGLVMASVTPFGQTSPWAEYRANNLVLSNLSGYSREHPGPVDDLESQPPLQLAAHQAEFAAGLSGAAAAAIALNRRARQGQGCHVDVSAMESVALLPQTALGRFVTGSMPTGRHKDEARLESLRAILPCRDGYVSISPRQQDQWERCVEMMGSPRWAEDPKFATRQDRVDNWNDLEPLLADWTSRHSKEEVYRQAQDRRIPAFPLNNAADLFHSPQFQARGFFQEVEHPEAGKLHYPGWPMALGSGRKVELSPAPLLGQHNNELLGGGELALPREQLAALQSRNVI